MTTFYHADGSEWTQPKQTWKCYIFGCEYEIVEGKVYEFCGRKIPLQQCKRCGRVKVDVPGVIMDLTLKSGEKRNE